MDELSVGLGELYTGEAVLAIVQGVEYNVGMVPGPWFVGDDWDLALIDVPSAVVMTGMDEDYIRKLCRLGKLEAFREAGRWYIRMRSIIAWERKTEGRGRPPAKPRAYGELGRIRVWRLQGGKQDTDVDENQMPLPGVE